MIRQRTRTIRGLLAVPLVVLALALLATCGDTPPTLTASPNRTDGTAVYMLFDVSGSMQDNVTNAAGAREQKLVVAKRAGIEVCRTIAKFAEDDAKRTIRLGAASFSDDYLEAFPMGKPDVARAERAINNLHTRGGTAIGDAVVQAQRSLDASGLKRQHIIVLTDGENNAGTSPEAVADALNALPENLRPSVYVVAFDVNAGVFSKVKAKGWQVFPAANAAQLQQQLDEVVGGHILIEK